MYLYIQINNTAIKITISSTLHALLAVQIETIT